MNFDEKIQNLQAQSQAANRDVIIQDRLLGQARERVAEIQGRINMLVELKAEENSTRVEKPKKPQNDFSKEPPKIKPGPKRGKKRIGFKYPDGLRNFCIKNIDKMSNQELTDAANEEFDLDLSKSRLTSYMKYNNIKRSKKGPLDDDDPDHYAED